MPQAAGPALEWFDPIFQTTKDKAARTRTALANAGFHETREYGYQVTMDHVTKQCVDNMHYTDTKMRDWLLSWLRDHADELGIEGLISNRQVYGFPSNGMWYRGPENTARPYSGPNPHTDHIHVMYNTEPLKAAHAEPPKRKPKAKVWTGKLWTLTKVHAYDGSGKRRPELDLPAGRQVTVTVDTTKFNDGRYARVGRIPHRVWYPLDNGGWSHEKGGVALREAGKPQVSLASVQAIVKAARLDPGRKQGGTTPGSADDVKVVEWALQQEGLLSKKYARDGSFGSSSVAAYAKWQKRLGYKGKDADGIPGKASLVKLGRKHGFTVTK